MFILFTLGFWMDKSPLYFKDLTRIALRYTLESIFSTREVAFYLFERDSSL
jgi:hypothetical protein